MKKRFIVLFAASGLLANGCGIGGGGLSLPTLSVAGSGGSGASILGLSDPEAVYGKQAVGADESTPGEGVVKAISADSSLNVQSLMLKPLQLWVSTSALCTSPVKVFDVGDIVNAPFVDFTVNPNIADGALGSGTYPCIIVVMSDIVKFTPSETSTSGNCVQGTEVVMDVCNTNGGALSFTLPDGTTGTCAGGQQTDRVEQIIPVHISTAATNTGSGNSNAFNAPTSVGDAANGMNLTSALVIGGANAATTFVADTTGKISDVGGNCDMSPPIWGFQ